MAIYFLQFKTLITMDREEHLKFCQICKEQKFDFKQGIICRLTNLPADFEVSCDSFVEDSKFKKKNELATKSDETQNKNEKKESTAGCLPVIGFGCLCFSLIDIAGIFFNYDLTSGFWAPLLSGVTGSALIAWGEHLKKNKPTLMKKVFIWILKTISDE